MSVIFPALRPFSRDVGSVIYANQGGFIKIIYDPYLRVPLKRPLFCQKMNMSFIIFRP